MAVIDEHAKRLARRAALLGPAYRLFHQPEPLHIVKGEGVWLFDSHGRRYLDAYNNVPAVGHCHPAVVEAIARQAAILNTHTRYLHDFILDYAEQLLATTPSSIDRIMLTCSGSEANDLALRIARHATDRTGIIATRTAYHGGTLAVAEFSPSLGPANPIGSHVRLVDPPEPGDSDGRFGHDVAAAIVDLQRAGHGIAALFLDSVLASDGVLTDPADAFVPAVTAVQDAGGLYIADEVQAGFGRTGDVWGFSARCVAPDIITLGKPMGNGHPIAGLMLSSKLADPFGNDIRYFNTLAGNPVSCAAAMAVLMILTAPGFLCAVRAQGERLNRRLNIIAQRYACVSSVRGRGLFCGVAIVDPHSHQADAPTSMRLVAAMKNTGVLVGLTGPHANVIKIRPPLVAESDHVDMIAEALENALSALPQRVNPAIRH